VTGGGAGPRTSHPRGRWHPSLTTAESSACRCWWRCGLWLVGDGDSVGLACYDGAWTVECVGEADPEVDIYGHAINAPLVFRRLPHEWRVLAP
jgi:hypothetical protein